MAKKNLTAAPEHSEATFTELPPSASEEAAEHASDISDAAKKTLKAARDLRRAQLMARGALNSPSIDTPPAPPAALPEVSRLDNILAQVTDEGKFEVHRQVGGSSMKVGVFPISEYPDRLETIASEYKGGTFKVTFKDRGGRIRGQDTQTFDAKAYGSDRSEPARESEDRSSHIMERMMERLEAREIEQRREMAEVRLESQRMMLEMMKLASGNRDQGMSVLDAIKVGKEMAGSASDPVESMSRLMEAMALMKDGVGKTEPQSPIVFAIEKALEVVSPILAVWAQKASASPLANPRVPAPGAEAPRRVLPPPAARVTPPAQAASPAPEPSIPTPAPTPDKPIDPQIQEYAVQLLTAAKTGMRPSLLAQLIVDGVPEEGADAFENMLDDEQTIPNLLRAEPQLVPYAGWLSSLMVELRDYYDSVTAEDPADAAPDAAPAPLSPAPRTAIEAVLMPAETPAPAPVGAPE